VPDTGTVVSARTRPRRRRWPWYVATLLVLAGATWAVVQADEPPMLLMQTARTAISATHTVDAEEWAPEFKRAAEESLLAASREIDRQNARFFVLRDYDRARVQAQAADALARQTLTEAAAARDSVKAEAVAAIERAGHAIRDARQVLNSVQLEGIYRRRVVQMELTRDAALKAAEEGRYRQSLAQIATVFADAQSVKEAVMRRLEDYHLNRGLWDRWARDTIEESRRNRDYAILVRKLERRCDVYFAGQLKASYPAELGIRWMGYKMRQGDHVTPEGRYRVSKKKTASAYYRALEINYPNADDRARHALAKKQGKIPRGAGIGSLIEIHGHGGRGTDWTQGCVALRNSDMDKIFAMADVGTPVTIVGSWDPAGGGPVVAR
jgi:L,D-peptidoglycan transpeptidase YkuD (ErfK/YbiS/YcfS/YnhG family)